MYGNSSLNHSTEDILFATRLKRVFCVLTGLLFFSGSLASVWVLKRVVQTSADRVRRGTAAKRQRAPSPPRHVYAYIGALVSADLLLLCNCPFIIYDMLYDRWYFGNFLCKFLYTNEALNKLLTGFLLALLSFDQLMTVKKILPAKLRSLSAAVTAILISFVLAVSLQIPLIVHTRVERFLYESDHINGAHLQNETNGTGGVNFTEVTYKCVFDPPPDFAPVFTVCIFVVGFCVPTLCILTSYGTIVYRVVASGYFKAVKNASAKRRGRTGNGHILTWYVLFLVVIYLCCWTPYWTIYAQMGLGSSESKDHSGTVYVMLFLHLLPYLNAVLNPFAYGYLVKCSSCRACSRKKRECDASELSAVQASRKAENSRDKQASRGVRSQNPIKRTLGKKMPGGRGTLLSLEETWTPNDSGHLQNRFLMQQQQLQHTGVRYTSIDEKEEK